MRQWIKDYYACLMLISMALELLMLGGILTLEILQYREHKIQLIQAPPPVITWDDCKIWNNATGKWEDGPCRGRY